MSKMAQVSTTASNSVSEPTNSFGSHCSTVTETFTVTPIATMTSIVMVTSTTTPMHPPTPSPKVTIYSYSCHKMF